MAPVKLVPIDELVLGDFCRRWKIAKLELLGSFARGNFLPQSDITYHADAEWGLLEHVRMQSELREIAGRKVDLVSRRAVEASHNVIRRNGILNDAVPIYSAV